MIELGAIQSQSTTYSFTKNDFSDLEITGFVTFDKDNNITNANGNISKGTNRIADFNIWGNIDLRFNINNCAEGMLIEASEALNATVNDLKTIRL